MASEERVNAGSSPGSKPGVAERGIVLFGKAMVALADVSVSYGALVAAFFFCCGVGAFELVNPVKSPLGPVITMFVVWPIGGLLCCLMGAWEICLRGLTRARNG